VPPDMEKLSRDSRPSTWQHPQPASHGASCRAGYGSGLASAGTSMVTNEVRPG
jgi:hypothetical protein